MDTNALIAMLTEGLDPAEAAIVRKSVERDAVKVKVTTIKDASEYQTVSDRAAQLQQELEGGPDKPGAKAYAKWYADHYQEIVQLHQDNERLKAATGQPTGTPNPAVNPGTGRVYTPEEIKALVREEASSVIQGTYAPRWSELLTSAATITQKHLYAGRKTPIDMPKLSKLAAEKYAGNLEQAYEEYDAPERTIEAKASTEKEIDRRVKEELQKRGASANFPAGADFTPGNMSMKPKADLEKFDRTALMQKLANTYVSGTTSEGVN